MKIAVFNKYLIIHTISVYSDEYIGFLEEQARLYDLESEIDYRRNTMTLEGENEKIYMFLVHIAWTLNVILE